MVFSRVQIWENSREVWGCWGNLVCIDVFIRRGLRLGFVIWAGIPLFYSMAPVRDLSEGYGGTFGFVFEKSGGRGGDWGG